MDILSTAARFYRVLGQSVMKRAEKIGFQKPPLFYENPAVERISILLYEI